MRSAVLVLAGALGLMAAATLANAAPAVPSSGTQQASNIVQIAGGCGPGFHPNRWGRCVPFRYGYGPRPYWRGGYARPWAGDYGAAEQLNRRELGRIYGY
jgi:hypothetical protein